MINLNKASILKQDIEAKKVLEKRTNNELLSKLMDLNPSIETNSKTITQNIKKPRKTPTLSEALGYEPKAELKRYREELILEQKMLQNKIKRTLEIILFLSSFIIGWMIANILFNHK
jgi:hypothetical protein